PPDARQLLSDLEQFMMGDLAVHMPASMCQRLDRASMAHSLEARVPLLSHRFVDFALSVPTELKLKGNTGKYVLRKAVEPWLPPAKAGTQLLSRRMSHTRNRIKTLARYVPERMAMSFDRKYLLRRSVQERELASTAASPRAAAIHFAMFAEYERRLSQIADSD